jgi:putative transcriptional regulator
MAYGASGKSDGGGKEGRSKTRCNLERLRDRQEKAQENMSKSGKELIESLQRAARHAAGKKVRGLRVSRVELPDVKAIRLSLRMSQRHFAAAFRIPLPTLKNWEQGRRMPDAPAAAYLLAIKRRPKEIMEAVARV